MSQSVETFNDKVHVVALVPEFHLVNVKNEKGQLFAITAKTEGVDYTTLKEGQELDCCITKKLPRVLRASLLPPTGAKPS